MIKFLFAKHRSAYINIAMKYYVWPEHVYKLAHGASKKGGKDDDICKALLDKRIIHRHHHSHNADDYEM